MKVKMLCLVLFLCFFVTVFVHLKINLAQIPLLCTAALEFALLDLS